MKRIHVLILVSLASLAGLVGHAQQTLNAPTLVNPTLSGTLNASVTDTNTVHARWDGTNFSAAWASTDYSNHAPVFWVSNYTGNAWLARIGGLTNQWINSASLTGNYRDARGNVLKVTVVTNIEPAMTAYYRQLYDANGDATVDFSAAENLTDATGVSPLEAIGWSLADHYLYGTNGNYAADYGDRLLIGKFGNGDVALDWGNRQGFDSNGAVAFDFSSHRGPLLKFGGGTVTPVSTNITVAQIGTQTIYITNGIIVKIQ